jgi:polyisoprenoid-binding protein YceI
VTTWILEPGHTEVEFRAMHMMVTWVRGLFKDIHGRLEFDWDTCLESTFEGEIDAAKLWTGEPVRDEHLRSAEANITIRGTTRTVPIDVSYLGSWKTPWWVDDENVGTIRRLGFEGRARVNRHDFGVSWQDELPGGGRVASDEIQLTFDVEAVHLGDLEETGAISYYRDG